MLGDEKTDDFFKNRKASCDFCYSKNLYLSNLIGPEMHFTWTLDPSNF